MPTLSENIEEIKKALLSDMKKQDEAEENEDGEESDVNEMDDMSIEDDDSIVDERDEKKAAEREAIENIRRSYIGPKTRYNYHGATARLDKS
jgi:hypothetical protein